MTTLSFNIYLSFWTRFRISSHSLPRMIFEEHRIERCWTGWGLLNGSRYNFLLQGLKKTTRTDAWVCPFWLSSPLNTSFTVAILMDYLYGTKKADGYPSAFAHATLVYSTSINCRALKAPLLSGYCTPFTS